MKRWLLGILPFVAVAAMAQSAADIAEELRQGSEEGRREVIDQSMSFSAAEAEVFWPAYDTYRLAMADVQKRLFALMAEYADAHPGITDELADHFMDEFVELKRDELAVKARHFPEFRKLLKPRRAARVIQLDTKLDALLNMDTAQNIPLVE